MAAIKDTFIPQLWSARLLAHLDKNLVLGNLVNRDYEGEIRNYGDTVKINQIGDITVKDYTQGTPIDYEDVSGEATELHIDQQKYWAFKVEDIDAAQANIALMDRAMERGFLQAPRYGRCLYRKACGGSGQSDQSDDSGHAGKRL